MNIKSFWLVWTFLLFSCHYNLFGTTKIKWTIILHITRLSIEIVLSENNFVKLVYHNFVFNLLLSCFKMEHCYFFTFGKHFLGGFNSLVIDWTILTFPFQSCMDLNKHSNATFSRLWASTWSRNIVWHSLPSPLYRSGSTAFKSQREKPDIYHGLLI